MAVDVPNPCDICPQVGAITLLPRHVDLLKKLDEEIHSADYKIKAYESLGGAIRIQSVSNDGNNRPSDGTPWEVEFLDYLKTRFPNVHSDLKRVEMSTYALVFEWVGKKDVKPLLISAHMDVVPVNKETWNDWKEEPFSGKYDGEWIWGRGSCDDKARVIASLSAIEMLLENNFVPSRPVFLAFGIDEEIGGNRGAALIRKYLCENYGSDSMAMIVDEGGEYTVRSGKVFATPAIAEKGYLDIHVSVSTPGGHSSRPPPHTGIGILADVITNLEGNPYQPKLYRDGPYYQGLECRARYDEGFPEDLRELVWKSQSSDEALRELEIRLVDYDPMFYALSGTTQAIDLIQGGIKVNALPENASAGINHRIADYSSVEEVKTRFVNITRPIAEKHGMTLVAFGETVLPGLRENVITLFIPEGKSVEPSPVSPTKGSGPYQLLSGIIRSTFETHRRTDDLPRETVVAPGLMTPNTDSHHYLELSKHIFRYGHRGDRDAFNKIHTVNEAIWAEGYLEQIRFFTRLIVNADESPLLD